MPKTPEERRAYQHAYSAANKEKIRLKNARYHAEHREEQLAKSRAYQALHKERLTAQRRAHYALHRTELAAEKRAHRAEHREAFLAQRRAYAALHRTELAAQKRAYRAIHTERVQAQKRAYYARHKERLTALRRAQPELGRQQARSRRAKKKGAPINDLTAAQWREIVAAYEHRCVYCGRTMQRLTQDHILPLSKGGSHTASNIVPACMSCNASKQAGPPPIPVQPLLLTLAPKKKPRKR